MVRNFYSDGYIFNEALSIYNEFGTWNKILDLMKYGDFIFCSSITEQGIYKKFNY